MNLSKCLNQTVVLRTVLAILDELYGYRIEVFQYSPSQQRQYPFSNSAIRCISDSISLGGLSEPHASYNICSSGHVYVGRYPSAQQAPG